MLIVMLIILALGIIVLLMRRDNQRMIDRFEHTMRPVLARMNLHEKDIPRSERVMTPWRSLGLVHFAARLEEGDRIRHIITCDHRLFGIMRDFTLGMVPDYRYNVPIFAADMMVMGPRRIMAVALIDTTGTEAAHLQQGYQRFREIRRHFANMLPLRNAKTTSLALPDLSFIVVANRRQDQLLLQLFQDYLTTWLDMARAAPPLASEMQQMVQAGVEHYVETLLEHDSLDMNFERLILGPQKAHRWVRTVGFGLAA